MISQTKGKVHLHQSFFMTKLQVGQPAPDAILQTINREPIQLSTAWSGGRHAMLIFLRHLA